MVSGSVWLREEALSEEKKRRAWITKERAHREKGHRPRKEPRIPLPFLTDLEKQEVETGTRPYGLMDYLFRLRLRTNYEDAAMFIEGPEEIGPSEQVREDLSVLAGTTMLLTEMCVRELLEPNTLIEWAKRWAERNTPKDVQVGLSERIPFLQNLGESGNT